MGRGGWKRAEVGVTVSGDLWCAGAWDSLLPSARLLFVKGQEREPSERVGIKCFQG